MDNFRMYFTDRQRGKVLRLSQDGLTPISDVGMKSFFRDEFAPEKRNVNLIGSFDTLKGEYNISFNHSLEYLSYVEFANERLNKNLLGNITTVSYTHLTLPTSDLV